MNVAATDPAQRQARIAALIFALLMAQQVASKATRDGIFLSQFSSSALPIMVASAAVTGLALSFVQARVLVRVGPNRIMAICLALSSGLHCAEWLLLGSHSRIAACILYVHVVAFGSILLSGFWSVMNESFDPRAAKAAFGRIGGFGTLGGLCGGLMAERVTAWFSAPSVVFLLAILHLCCAALVWRGFPSNRSAPESSLSSSESTVPDAVKRYPFLVKLASLVLAASVGASLLDFVFKAQAAQALGRGGPLVQFFGLYYTSISLLVFLVQTFVTPFALKTAGIAKSVAVLPTATAAGSLAAVFIPGFNLLTGIRGTEALLRGSIYRSAYELFYTAVAPGDKRAVKPVIDVGFERLGDALGAGSVSLLLAVAPRGYGLILITACVSSGIALFMALRLQTGYVRALEKSLFNRAVEIDPGIAHGAITQSFLMRSVVMPTGMPVLGSDHPQAEMPSANSDMFVRRALDLRSRDPERVTGTLSSLGPSDWTLGPLIIELLAWNQVMPVASATLRRMGPRIIGMLIDTLLDPDGDFTIRRRIPRVLAFLPSSRSVDGLYAALQDRRFEVRFYAGRALYLLFREHPELTLPHEQVWAVINRELNLQKSTWQAHNLLDNRDSGSKEWFFDDQLLDRADRNLEHLFTLLALLLPVDAVRIAFRALHTDDRQLKGMAFEYLESATPAHTRHLLIPFLEADTSTRPAMASEAALARLMKTEVKINETLQLAMKTEARR